MTETTSKTTASHAEAGPLFDISRRAVVSSGSRIARRTVTVALATATLCAVLPLQAREATSGKGKIVVEQPWASATPSAARNGVVYVKALSNRTDQADRLISGSTPVARSVELHRMEMRDDVARMVQMDAIDIPAHGSVDLTHDGTGMHLMLIDLKSPLKKGQTIPMTLKFERAGTVKIDVPVRAATPRDATVGGHDAGAAHTH